jgi:predicted PurR-regulated permease PerM
MRPKTIPNFSTAVLLLVVGAIVLLWWVRFAIVVFFAAILISIVLRVVARAICRITPLGEAVGILLAVLFLFAILLSVGWLFGWRIAGQFHLAVERIREGQAATETYLAQHGLDSLAKDIDYRSADFLRAALPALFPVGLRVLETGIVLLISAIYLAVDPTIYRQGFALLFGKSLFHTVDDGLSLVGTSLELWLVGQIIAMVMVGILCALATWAIGLPGPIALGLIACFAEIVPYLGPFFGAIPALFAALTLGLDATAWTAGLYLCVHCLEGYVLSPLLQRHFIFIPPALVLIGIFTAGLLFGISGIVIGAPLTAAIFIATKVFYIRDALEEKTEIPKDIRL